MLHERRVYTIVWALYSVLVALVLAILLSMLFGCDANKAEASVESRWKYECVHIGMYCNTNLLTDSETGQQWIVVFSNQGVAIAPYEEADK